MLRLLENQLADKKFFGGDKLNISDFYVTSWLFSAPLNPGGNPKQAEVHKALGLGLYDFPSIQDYVENMDPEVGDYIRSRENTSF